ncbi:SpoIIE family protein phosphatase [Thermospira aquatica]|uniref:SpoIIE family protein phosphatase n=1 Tax=Thermospira aquatica TaxID=2828656 RepID=A0AAX3BGF7_9SPIR|nr:SpoIIE family protein phosphatase [Thermospira aquatica]URA11183.1 SpoIIE family protein phosphatase [Thermospira aquatica]
MSPFIQRMSIRKKLLFVLVLFILSFMSALSVVLYMNASNQLRNSVEEQLQNNVLGATIVAQTALNTAIKNYVKYPLEETYRFLEDVTKKKTLKEAQIKESVLKLLKDVELGRRGFAYILTLKGDVVFHPDRSLIGQNVVKVGARDVNGLLYHMNILADALTLPPGQVEFIEYTVEENGQLVEKIDHYIYYKPLNWVIVLSTYKADFRNLINPMDFRNDIVKLKIGKTGAVEIFTSLFTQVIHSTKMLESRIRDTEIHRLIQQKTNGMMVATDEQLFVEGNDTENVKKVKTIYAFRYLPELDWFVVASVSYGEAFAPATMLGMISFFFTLIFVGLTIFVLSLVVNRMIVNHILVMKQGVMAFGARDFSHRIEVKTGDELENLATSFNEMADTIQTFAENLELMVQQRTLELQMANEELSQKNHQMMLELEMAQRVQEHLIPSVEMLPQREEMDFGVSYMAMENVGGDLYDCMLLRENLYALLIADVSGHGVPAALISSMAKALFQSRAHEDKTPGQFLKELNTELLRLIGDLDHYITAYYGILNIETGDFLFANGGHHPVLLLSSEKNEVRKLDAKGFLIGMMEEVVFETDQTKLQPGDKLVFFTDGIVEAHNAQKEQYGYERFQKCLVEHQKLPPKDLVGKVWEDVQAFCEGVAQSDDMTLFIVEFKGYAKPVQWAAATCTETAPSLSGRQENLYEEALKLLGEGKIDAALKTIQALSLKRVSDARIYNQFGVAFFKAGRLQEAVKMFEKALTLDAGNETIKKNLELVKKKLGDGK